MRPYFAIIKDSFRAALASRVLYVLLGLITMLLLALSPFHVREVLDWKIQFGEHVKKPEILVAQIMEKKDDPERPEVARVWDMMSDSTQKQVTEIYERSTEKSKQNENEPLGQRMSRYGQVIDELNKIIEKPDFYRAEDWADHNVGAEAESLIKRGPESLNTERSRRLNRLLIASAFPGAIESGPETSLDFYYGFWKWDWISATATRQQFETGINVAIPYVFDKFVLSIGLFIAILVTANIIPETFEPGSLNLLLSKPISRWALFISKFIGGCAFVALCAVYLFLGTWLWLGLGLGIWDRAFLWSIPLYILVFMIYYSVSSLIGLSYRSTILAIVVTGLFWAFCFGIGSGYGFLNAKMQNSRLIALAPVNGQIMSVNSIGRVLAWKPDEKQWTEVVEGELPQEEKIAESFAVWLDELRESPLRMSPLFDSKNGRVYTGASSVVNPFAANHQNFLVADAENLNFKKIGKFPRDAMAMYNTEDGLLVVTGEGNFLLLAYEDISDADSGAVASADDPDLKGPTVVKSKQVEFGESDVTQVNSQSESVSSGAEPGEQEQSSSDQTSDVQSAVSLTGDSTNKSPEPKQEIEDLAKRVGPENPVFVRDANSVAYNQSNGQVAIFSYREGKHLVYTYQLDGSRYRQRASVELNTGSSARMRCKIAYQGNTILVVVGNGQVITIDSNSMQEKQGYFPESSFAIESISASQDGRWFALLYRNQVIWLLDTQNDAQIRKPKVTGQGTVSAVSFDDLNRMWVADRTDRVSCYDPATMDRKETLSPAGDLIANAYRYVVKPTYTICPKPSEFYKVVTHLSDSGNTKRNAELDLTQTEKKSNPFAPLWSGLGFMAVMLMLACTIFHFKDY